MIIFAILLTLILYFDFSKANTDVKENKENEKKADPLKEPPLEPDSLSRVGTVIFNPFANYIFFVSHGRARQSDSFNLRTPLCKSSTFQASYFNRIVKLWNYVCKLAPPTSFCSPNALQLFVR